MSDDEIELYLLIYWDIEFRGVVWDESGRTVIDRAACVKSIKLHKEANQ